MPQHPPLTPASFAAIAKSTLGWEHPNISVGNVTLYGQPQYYQAVCDDADCLDLLATGAFRVVRERWDVNVRDCGDNGSSGCVAVYAYDQKRTMLAWVTISCSADDCTDPANVYKLLCQLHDKGVRDGK